MQQKLSKTSVVMILIIALLGVITTVRTILLAINYFVLPLFIIHILEVLCFAWVIYYALNSHAQSSKFFRSMFITLGLILAVQASLDPDLFTLPHSYTTILLAFLAVTCLTVIYCKWTDYALCKILSWVTIAATLISAVVTTFLPLESIELPEPAIPALAEVYTRPLLTICVLGCYMARMSKKAKEEK